ncbi:Alpha/Beta hydrolase protein [Schizophyllum amplum]|uniref:Alpha/Beta hydrolase protein n=1 Tax=Schizophyllum amplum TaxID=97359 RepID=A0A550CPQ6_9AGAR|nr:Alpha/Beta hydrolase protein [Auriculariopsis ampla]
MAKSYALRHQPIKAVYLTGQVLATCLVRLPIWLLISLPVSWRPRPSWTLKQCIIVKLVRLLNSVADQVGSLELRAKPNHEAIVPGEGVNGFWIEPVPDLVVGDLKVWATAQDVHPVRIPGYWIHNSDDLLPPFSPPQPGEKTLLQFHGGGYKSLSAHPTDITANISKGLLQHCAPLIRRALSVEYRLSNAAPFPARNPFPAALLDALAAYVYLVQVAGFAPQDIIVEGDSAGGNLALALTRYLVEHAGEHGVPPPPGRLLLASPWCDIGSGARPLPGSSWRVFWNAGLDYLRPGGGLLHCGRAFGGALGLGALDLNRYVSPASLHPALGKVPFKGFPPTFISAGGCEALLDEIRVLRDRMTVDLGESMVAYREEPDAPHDFMVLKWEPATTDTYKAIARWLGL